MILEVFFAFIGIVTFGMVLNMPKKQLLYCGLTGGFGWFVYLMTKEISGGSPYIATLCSAFALTIMSRHLSVIRKAPATVFLLSGIFTLVPGAGMYYTAYNMFMDRPDIAMDHFSMTIKIALQIALGIAAGYVLPPHFGEWFKKRLGMERKINNSAKQGR